MALMTKNRLCMMSSLAILGCSIACIVIAVAVLVSRSNCSQPVAPQIQSQNERSSAVSNWDLSDLRLHCDESNFAITAASQADVPVSNRQPMVFDFDRLYIDGRPFGHSYLFSGLPGFQWYLGRLLRDDGYEAGGGQIYIRGMGGWRYWDCFVTFQLSDYEREENIGRTFQVLRGGQPVRLSRRTTPAEVISLFGKPFLEVPNDRLFYEFPGDHEVMFSFCAPAGVSDPGMIGLMSIEVRNSPWLSWPEGRVLFTQDWSSVAWKISFDWLRDETNAAATE